MTQKITLTTKITQNFTDATNAQIEAIKALWIATLATGGIEPTFEIDTENEESSMERFLRMVRAEFAEADAREEIAQPSPAMQSSDEGNE